MAKSKAVKKPRLDSVKIAKLYRAQPRNEKSISTIAEKVGGSYVGVRLNLISQGLLRA